MSEADRQGGKQKRDRNERGRRFQQRGAAHGEREPRERNQREQGNAAAGVSRWFSGKDEQDGDAPQAPASTVPVMPPAKMLEGIKAKGLPFFALTEDEQAAVFKAWGQPAFRATQLREFVFRRGVTGYDGVTNLSMALREQLAAFLPLYALTLAERSPGDEAEKWLWRAADGALVESVQIRSPDWHTSCVSSQVGCAMGCAFCATGRGGFERNLRWHEIVAQYLLMEAHSKTRSTNIVFMGMGEPLLNYDEVMAAVRALHDPPPKGAGVGARRITISTVGVVPGILKLAGENLQLELAISLHAPDEKTRRALIPSAARFSIREILGAAEEYARRTRRLVTYEYVLLAGVNDSEAQARELAALLRTHPCKANLIPFNAVDGAEFSCPPIQAQERFKHHLENAGIPVTIRYSKGRAVDAACGQLRRRAREQQAEERE